MNVARFLFVGITKLGYTEAEFFRMTPKKFFRLLDECLEMNGVRGKGDECAIDTLP